MNTVSFILRFFIGTYIQVFLLSLMFVLKAKPKKYGLIVWLISSAALYLLQFFTSVDYPAVNKFFVLFGWFDIRHLLIVVLYAVVVCFCFDLSVMNVIFIVTFCTVAQNFCHHFARSLYHIFIALDVISAGEYKTSFFSRAVNVSVFVIASCVIYFSVAKDFKADRELTKEKYSVFILSATFALFAYVFNQYVTTVHDGCIPYHVVSTLLCVVLDVLMNEIMRRKAIADDNEVMARIIATSEKTRRISEENVELINRKCHDLKHQIAALRASSDIAERDESLKKIEEAVNIYDSTVKTGNRVLDSLFMEKGLSCREHGIVLTVCLDGKKLAFMSAVDLYVLFGNALDNAIESCLKEEKAKRFISVSSSQKGGIFCVGIENACSKKVEFENGLPVTSKEKNGYHGFGTGSIRHVAEKYGGEVNFDLYDGAFCLDMMFDLAAAKAKSEQK